MISMKNNLIKQVIDKNIQSITNNIKAVVKTAKRVTVSVVATTILISILGGCTAENGVIVPDIEIVDFNEATVVIPPEYSAVMTAEQRDAYINVKRVASEVLTTHKGDYKDDDGITREYTFVSDEAELVAINRALALAIKDYFKTYDASDWTNPDNEQFWPEDVDLLMTAIAWRETEYRADAKSSTNNCAGIAGLDKDKLLKTLTDSGWLQLDEWGASKPYINCNPAEIDVFNPVVCLEYSYYNMGYNLANRLKKDKYFNDEVSGDRISIWQKLDYSEEMQLRLIISSHLFGVNNVVDSVFDRNYDKEKQRYIKLSEYIYSDYTNDVLDKYYELCKTYSNDNVLGK